MKIQLINPAREKSKGFVGGGGFTIAPTSVAAVAALSPDDVDVSITDEMVENIDFDGERPDLVGITVMSQTAQRAYQIAGEYRKRGIPVVLGGIHPTILPQEAIRYADAICIGEAEETWPALVKDFQRGNMQRFYRSPALPDLDNLPLPRRDLLKKYEYVTINTVHTTRGCPFNCSFCSVSKYYGKTFRFRPIEDVIREVDALEGDAVFFTDDNIGGNLKNAKKLFKELIPLKKRWVSQTTLSSTSDEEFLDLAARSGCAGLFIGFESLSVDNLREIGKKQSPGRYEEIIKRIHDHRISIAGSFIFGLDNDDRSVFEKALEFAIRTSMMVIQINVLTPFPGTELYDKLRTEGRLLAKKWWLTEPPVWYGIHYKPRLMSGEDLRKGCIWVSKKFYSYGSMLGRIKTLHKKELGLGSYLQLNLGFRKLMASNHLEKGYSPGKTT